MDKIEESPDPHTHPEPSEAAEATRQIRRLKLFDADVKRFGLTNSCQRCEYIRQNKPCLARGVRHNEECQARICEALRAAGFERVQRADLEDSSRTVTRSRKARDPLVDANVDDKPADAPMADGAPTEPLPDIADATPNDEPTVHDYNVEDTFNFHEEINAELGDGLDVDWDNEPLHDGDGDHVMATLVNVLQTTSVAVGDAAEYAVHIMKNRTAFPVTIGKPYNPQCSRFMGMTPLLVHRMAPADISM